MLKITISGGEFWDSSKEEFFTIKPTTLHLGAFSYLFDTLGTAL